MGAAKRSQRVRDWMFNKALPLWLARGVEPETGAFVEALDFTAADAGIAFRRTRVACRQIYVFSHAAVLGWTQGLDAAKAGARWLLAHAWRPDQAGFVRRTDRAGATIDPAIDLYDNAFAVFAFAWLTKATGEAVWADWARKTLIAATTTLAHPSGEGFYNDETRSGWRQQNPHMHLTEACLAALDATGEPVFAQAADRLVDLCSKRFTDGRTLAEFFQDDWRRAPGDAGRHIEPGHMFEWAWILGDHMRLSGADHRATMTAFIAFGEAHGVDHRTGATFNVVRDDELLLDGGSRTWPNTERVKAAVAAHQWLAAPEAAARAHAAVDILLDRYFVQTPSGGWRDQFDAQGEPVAPNMPASTLYHAFFAFAEALRLGGSWLD